MRIGDGSVGSEKYADRKIDGRSREAALGGQTPSGCELVVTDSEENAASDRSGTERPRRAAGQGELFIE